MVALQAGLQEALVRRMYSEASDREVFIRMEARRLDSENMIRVINWAPERNQLRDW